MREGRRLPWNLSAKDIKVNASGAGLIVDAAIEPVSAFSALDGRRRVIGRVGRG